MDFVVVVVVGVLAWAFVAGVLLLVVVAGGRLVERVRGEGPSG